MIDSSFPQLRLNPVSLLVTVVPETLLMELEGFLNEESLTLGFVPRPAKKRITIGQILGERTPNKYGLYYGEVDDLCVSLKVLWNGEEICTRNVPRSATGPDFKKLFIGTRGRYGKILEATFRVSPYAFKRRKLRVVWPSPEARGAFEKRLWACGVRPLLVHREGAQGLIVELAGRGDRVRTLRECLRRLAQETGGDFK